MEARRRRHRTDEPHPVGALPPDRRTGGLSASVLALQQRAGNRTVKALLERRFEVAPPPDGPTATTVVAGRQLSFRDAKRKRSLLRVVHSALKPCCPTTTKDVAVG